MKAQKKKYLALGICLFTVAFSIYPCGPFFETTIFSFLYTQYDKKGFELGEPTFIKPSFFRRDLTIAYRYLLGNKKIKESIRLNSELTKGNSETAISTWLKARQNSLGLKEPGKEFSVSKYIKGQFYSSYTNCMDDSFRFATQTLKEREKQFGIKSKEVIAWVTGQDIVFSNCSNEYLNIPSNLNYAKDHITVKDRQYQIASAYFYGGDFDKSISLFKEISEDKESPYNNLARYLIVRSVVRKSFLAKETGPDIATLKEAEKLSSNLISSPGDIKLRSAILNQWRHIQFYLNPMVYLIESEDSILNNPSVSEMVRNDFAHLLETHTSESRIASKMADWILNFRSEVTKDNLEYALKKWKEEQTTPWFVSVISKISASHKDANSILEDARHYKADNYAYLTVSYHRIRLLINQNRMLAAKNLLNEVLNFKDINPSDINLFLNFKVYFAKTEREFLQTSYLYPVGNTYDDGTEETKLDLTSDKSRKEPHFTLAFAKIWNENIPIDAMVRIYKSQKIPSHLEENFLFSIFARAVLLKRLDIIEKLSTQLGKNPLLKEEMKTFKQAQTETEKEFITVLTLLRLPGIKPNVQYGFFRSDFANIDNYRDNWWCTFSESKEEDYNLFSRNPIFNYSRLKFISEKEEEIAKKEWETLRNQGAAPDYLTASVLDYFKLLPDNAYMPEALHLAVKTTRYGCTGEKTTDFSRSAFQLLHRNFSKSEWTKKTPYHY